MRRFGSHYAPALGLFFVVPVMLTTIGADPVFSQAPFYQGKAITLIIGAGPGGMGDLRARARASVLVKHIPGNPTITFQYMAGAGGRRRPIIFTIPLGPTVSRSSGSPAASYHTRS